MATVLDTARMRQLIQQQYNKQTVFAEACGVSRQYISDVLQRKQIPTLERMIQFAELLSEYSKGI